MVPIGERSWVWAHRDFSSSMRAAYANPPDWPEMLVWKNRLGPGDLFVDIGANIGLYTIWAAELGAKVIAVEPDPGAAGMLRENLSSNGYGAVIIEAAVADRNGLAKLTGELDVQNHLVLGPSTYEDGCRDVRVLTLDDIIGDRCVAGVKIDVEGAEALVLKGGMRALSEGRIRCLQLEWNDRSIVLLRESRSSIIALLQLVGYDLYRPDSDGVLVRVDEPSMGDPDVFALPSSESE